jgi:hypothetical protein
MARCQKSKTIAKIPFCEFHLCSLYRLKFAPCILYRARTFKCLWGPGIDSKEWIPPVYVAWRAGTITLFLIGA